MNELLKSKTFWTGVIAVISAASGFFTGGIPVGEAIQIAITGLIGIFLRDAIRVEPTKPTV